MTRLAERFRRWEPFWIVFVMTVGPLLLVLLTCHLTC